MPPAEPRGWRARSQQDAARPRARRRFGGSSDPQSRRFLIIATVALVAAIAIILGAGYAYDNFYMANQPAAIAYGQTITLHQVADLAKQEAAAIDQQAALQGGTSNPTVASQVDSQKRSLPTQVVQLLIQQAVIDHEAQARHITVSSQEVDARVQQIVAQFQQASNPPVPSPSPGLPASPSPSPGASPAAGAIPAPSPGLAASPSPAPSATSVPTPPATPTPLPTLAPSAFQSAQSKLLAQYALSESSFRDQVRQDLLQTKVQNAIEDQVPAKQEQVHVRQILVATQATAQDIQKQLQQGKDFAALAKQYSTDAATKNRGGDLGWVPKGIGDPAFDKVAFSLKPGQVSDPVQLPTGWAIIQVLEVAQDRPVATAQLDQLRTNAFNTWLTSQENNSSQVKMELDGSKQDWVLRQIGIRP